MTATERLRQLLDERGVEWMGTSYTKPTQGHPTNTSLDEEYNDAVFIEYFDGNVLRLFDLTPEQAVEATLGRGTCKVVGHGLTACDDIEFHWYALSCGHRLRPLWAAHVIGMYCPECGRMVAE